MDHKGTSDIKLLFTPVSFMLLKFTFVVSNSNWICVCIYIYTYIQYTYMWIVYTYIVCEYMCVYVYMYNTVLIGTFTIIKLCYSKENFSSPFLLFR